MESDQSVHVAYAGKPLESKMPCFWKVMVWNKDGMERNCGLEPIPHGKRAVVAWCESAVKVNARWPGK